MDPNTQDIPLEAAVHPEARLAQAAIPSVLTALYKILKTDAGVQTVLNNSNPLNWAATIFGKQKTEVIKRIASYSSYTQAETEIKINEISAEAVNIIKDNLKDEDKIAGIKDTLTSERNNILPYLPAILNIGELLGDTTLDDKTNKMEGPISTLMHKIEQGFSNPD
ncbi:MAG: hypothetical protein IPJ81_19520 [Chitinophagaceae bacterium]|nr:hypothetical protein [Chitinophagaceae bacterium]